ncbi:hypothetical protein D9V34_08620 [Mycetocola lacteus]|uniref:ABC transporter ATP-binding protein n=1 Tax=Mycetocola lacteus TaxID=76637 RepID=A0A3L7AUV2_9MICO|nr:MULTISPECIES: hypothetical protein [Mycetocola]MCS4274898.1 hypothetical protein [Mycetocola sp. BIGb0189]RLP83278.1 hypothetical protein D9V34_08620 [Mycetocola lacteus]
MRIELRQVTKGKNGSALPETSLQLQTGAATFARAETEQRPTVLGLIASGRMRPDSGTVLIDGQVDASRIRREIALVDAPIVSEPAGNVAVSQVVAEELMFAGLKSHPIAVARTLDEMGLRDRSSTDMADLAPTDRIRMLTELAARRPEVRGIVLVSPDRHGGDPEAWWRIARELAARDLAVLVIAGVAAHTAISSTREIEPLADVPSDSATLFNLEGLA